MSNKHKTCYYGCDDPSWVCLTCREQFCSRHSHTTELGNNIECVACALARLDKQRLNKNDDAIMKLTNRAEFRDDLHI